MVYIDEKGRKYEVQYCIILREGKDAGIRQYVWASEEDIMEVLKLIVLREEITEQNTLLI